MARLGTRFPDFGLVFDGNKMRAMVQHLENLFSKIRVDQTLGAYVSTANQTLTADDDVVLIDTTGGNITVTLPEISDSMIREKQEFELVKIVAANTLTITPTGSDTIVDDTDAIVTIQWTALRFRAATGNWVIV